MHSYRCKSIGVFCSLCQKWPYFDISAKNSGPHNYKIGGIIMIKVTLKDGKVLEVEEGKTVLEVAKQISEGLARMATCATVNGEVKDLRYELKEDCNLSIETFENSEDGKKAYWHTTAHIMAQAVKRLFPNTKLGIGPAIENGFTMI